MADADVMRESGSGGKRPRHVLRSIGAVLAGILLGAVPAVGTDLALVASGVFPPFGERMPDALLLLATTYRSVYSIMGSYLTARLAPSRPMQHALVLGTLGLIAATAGAVATLNAGPAFEPKWYPLALIALAMPCAWAGGKLRARQLRG